jgi:hypothetical protein
MLWLPSRLLTIRTKGKAGCVALKLDISKAYDRMSWEYLKDVLIRMGFSDKWVHWMAMCVELVDYSVLVNGEQVRPVIPGRGLRQGILYPLTCLFCVLKGFLPLLVVQKLQVILPVLPFVGVPLGLPACYLLMTASLLQSLRKASPNNEKHSQSV